jgi:hypothetical protein
MKLIPFFNKLYREKRHRNMITALNFPKNFVLCNINILGTSENRANPFLECGYTGLFQASLF